MAELLSLEMIAVSLAKVAVREPGYVGRSAVYSRYKSGPNMLPCGTPAFMDVSSEYSFSTCTTKCRLCR
jgi:hypothetical protein